MERDKLYLGHMADSMDKIQKYMSGVDIKSFIENHQMSDAVILNIMLIGEAAKKVSNEFKQAHPDIPWRDVMGMRDKLVHDYAEIDLNEVWNTATVDIPTLRKQLS